LLAHCVIADDPRLTPKVILSTIRETFVLCAEPKERDR